jgi:hypothetical protein
MLKILIPITSYKIKEFTEPRLRVNFPDQQGLNDGGVQLKGATRGYWRELSLP